MSEITKDKALEIANQYFGNRKDTELILIENPGEFKIYGLEEPEECYRFHVISQYPNRVGQDNVICISKDTGKIYTGRVGE